MSLVTINKKDTKRGSLVLVNPSNPLKARPQRERLAAAVEEHPEILMDRQAAVLLRHLLETIQAGRQITVVSGYRSKEEQLAIWNDTITTNGPEFTRRYVAMPGHSEHESGLAIDLAQSGGAIDFIRPEFPRTGIFKKFREQAPRFGFVERYLSGKENITGISEEPWHFRYVGFPHSMIIAKEGMVLEEYIRLMRTAAFFEKPLIYEDGKTHISVFCIPMEGEQQKILDFPGDGPYTLSGTNEDAVVLSCWRA